MHSLFSLVECAAGQEVEVDLEKDVLTVIDSGKQYPLKSIGEVSVMICVRQAWNIVSMTGSV